MCTPPIHIWVPGFSSEMPSLEMLSEYVNRKYSSQTKEVSCSVIVCWGAKVQKGCCWMSCGMIRVCPRSWTRCHASNEMFLLQLCLLSFESFSVFLSLHAGLIRWPLGELYMLLINHRHCFYDSPAASKSAASNSTLLRDQHIYNWHDFWFSSNQKKKKSLDVFSCLIALFHIMFTLSKPFIKQRLV